MFTDGKLLRAASVALSKLIPAELATILRADGSVPMTGPLDAGGQRLINGGAPTAPTDFVRLQDMYNLPWKEKARFATTGNVNLATVGVGTAHDGITPVNGDRALVWKQTAAAENGLYTVGTPNWTRTPDADSAAELRGMFVQVEQGTLYGDHRFALTTDNFTLGTTPLTIVDTGVGTPAAFPTLANKGMTASVATTDGALACATAITYTPAGDGYVRVHVDGIAQTLGDGVKTKDFYFSGDGGTTARAIGAITAGDLLYINPTIAGFTLAATDIIDLDYLV